MNDEKVKKINKPKKNKVKKNSTGPLLLNELLVVEEPPLSHTNAYSDISSSYCASMEPEKADSYADKEDEDEEDDGNRYLPVKYQKIIPIIIGD